MQRMTLVALGSLVALAVLVTIYGYYPLPSSGITLSTPHLALSLALLAAGLVAFVVLLVSGLIVILNAGSNRGGRRGDAR